MVARALGEWTAGIKTAWEEGRAVGASKNCDARGAGPGVSWRGTQSEKFALGRQEGRFFGGQMVGGRKEEVEKAGNRNDRSPSLTRSQPQAAHLSLLDDILLWLAA